MKDSLIIVSGGMDSVTLLHEKKESIALAISFDYGSNHNQKEIPFAKLHCERLGIKHIVIPLNLFTIISNPLSSKEQKLSQKVITMMKI